MNLKRIRLDMKMSRSALSKKSGVPQRTIERIESTGNCTVKTAIKLADTLDVSLDELCRDTQEE